jgi:two-component system, OmpR family, response regulator
MTRVLVADDSETILLLLRTRLEMEGYEVVTATDGQQVLDTIAGGDPAQRPDVILLDAMMPGKSGIDALRELRGSGVDTPVLFVSAYGEQKELSDTARLGADGLVAKPIDFDELLGRVADLAGA